MGIFTLPPPKHSLAARHSKHYPTNLFILLRFCLAVLLASTLSFQAQAQAQAQVKPVASLKYFTYTSLEEKTMYIHGGDDDTNLPTNQFFALDLTKRSWTTDNPPWKEMPKKKGGPPEASRHAMAVSEKEIYFWIPKKQLIGTYDLKNGAWWTRPLPDDSTEKSGRNSSEIVPGDLRGLFIVAHGVFHVLAGDYTRRFLMSFRKSDNTIMTLFMPMVTGNKEQEVLQITQGYGVAWSVATAKSWTYGGTTPNGTYNTNVLEYIPLTAKKQYYNDWEIPNKVPSGTSPGEISEHCMVPAYKGSKMVVFGGRSRGGDVRGSIFFLDVLEMKWSKGPDADPSQHRTGMACTVAGDNVVIWGGIDGNGQPLKDEMIIFNMLLNVWTKEFRLPVAPPNITNYIPSPSRTVMTPTSTATPASRGIDVKAATIGGGTAGGVLVLLFIGCLLYSRFRRRFQRRRPAPEKFDTLSELDKQSDKNSMSLDLTHSRNGSAPQGDGTLTSPNYAMSDNQAYVSPPQIGSVRSSSPSRFTSPNPSSRATTPLIRHGSPNDRYRLKGYHSEGDRRGVGSDSDTTSTRTRRPPGSYWRPQQQHPSMAGYASSQSSVLPSQYAYRQRAYQQQHPGRAKPRPIHRPWPDSNVDSDYSSSPRNYPLPPSVQQRQRGRVQRTNNGVDVPNDPELKEQIFRMKAQLHRLQGRMQQQ